MSEIEHVEDDPFFVPDDKSPLHAVTVEVAKLEMKPGDILVVRFTIPVTVEQTRAFQAALNEWREKHNVTFPILVLANAVELTKAEASGVAE